MPLVATDAIVNRRTSSAGTLFCPVATGAPIKCGSNRHRAPQAWSSQLRPLPGDQPHTDGGRNHRPGPPKLALMQVCYRDARRLRR
jgi:hypothetical protein